MPSQGTSTFDLLPLRFHFEAARETRLEAGEAANLFRGQFGKVLYRRYPDLYESLFAPKQASGPSGFEDPPRPFVLRVRHLETIRGAFHVGINLFQTYDPRIGEAVAELAREHFAAALKHVEGLEPLRLPLEAGEPATQVRVRFLTSTELKPAGPPEFAVLAARVRDRISTLRAFYGEGALSVDFRAMGERAAKIRMTRCELKEHRLRRTTGSRHPLDGFTGVAEYEGDLAEFLPYLEIARHTGVGRQTVWGKGEIAVETF